MNNIVVELVFYGIFTVWGGIISFRLLFTPEWIDRKIQKTGEALRKEPPDQPKRYAFYRTTGFLLLLFTLFAALDVLRLAALVVSN